MITGSTAHLSLPWALRKMPRRFSACDHCLSDHFLHSRYKEEDEEVVARWGERGRDHGD